MARRPGYSDHRRLRKLMLDPPVVCAHCKRERATELDHDPPLAMHVHRKGSGCCRRIPSCGACNGSGGLLVSTGEWRPGAVVAGVEAEPEPERDGIPANDRRWRVPWLAELAAVPADATWPRLMTPPHRRAVGTL